MIDDTGRGSARLVCDGAGPSPAESGADDGVGVGVVTVSSTLSLAEDAAGDAVQAAFEDGGHEVATRELIEASHDNVQAQVSRLVDRSDVDVVVTVGGTSIAPDDVTLEAVRPLIDKNLPAFGELYHRLSYEAVGTRVVCRRTLGGVADGVPVFCLPGGEDRARLAVEGIIVPEASHLVSLANDDEADEDGDGNGAAERA